MVTTSTRGGGGGGTYVHHHSDSTVMELAMLREYLEACAEQEEGQTKARLEAVPFSNGRTRRWGSGGAPTACGLCSRAWSSRTKRATIVTRPINGFQVTSPWASLA